jgi:hypothetical protein
MDGTKTTFMADDKTMDMSSQDKLPKAMQGLSCSA